MSHRALASAAAGFGAVLALATPAWAHGGEAPTGTDYRTEVTGLAGALPDVSVRVIEAGARLQLVNRGRQTVEVLGYQGEPYLEVRPDGVYENLNSPATYLNATLRGGEVPARADVTAPPEWRKAGDEPRARWHDHRAHWMGAQPPSQVTAEPGRRHRIRDWVVPLRVGVTTVEVRGTLDYIPPPVAGAWWAGAVLGAACLGALGLLPPHQRSTRSPAEPPTGSARSDRTAAGPDPPPAGPDRTTARPDPPPAEPDRTAAGGGSRRVAGAALAVLSVLAGLTAIGYAVARELDAGATGSGAVLSGLAAGQVWPVLTGLGALAAGLYALARRPSADFALALAGACLALFAGVANASVLGRGVAPVPFPADLARLAVVAVIAAGAGLALAGALRLRTGRARRG